jgi:hypothetical protein
MFYPILFRKKGVQLLLGGFGHGWESLAHGMDPAGMSAVISAQVSADRPHIPAALARSSESSEGFALHELWLEPVDGVWEPQGPERLCLLPALQHPQAGPDLAMRLRDGPLGLAFRWLSVGARFTVILAGIIRVTNVT